MAMPGALFTEKCSNKLKKNTEATAATSLHSAYFEQTMRCLLCFEKWPTRLESRLVRNPQVQLKCKIAQGTGNTDIDNCSSMSGSLSPVPLRASTQLMADKR